MFNTPNYSSSMKIIPMMMASDEEKAEMALEKQRAYEAEMDSEFADDEDDEDDEDTTSEKTMNHNMDNMNHSMHMNHNM